MIPTTSLLLAGVLACMALPTFTLQAQEKAPKGDAPKLAPTEAKNTKSTDRKISAHDVLYIEVYGERDLTGERQVQATGNISFPFLDAISVAGKTPAEVETYIKERLDKDYIVDPQVTVSVKRYVQRTVAVFGEVNQPRLVDLPADQKWGILDAIAAAGGYTRLAKSTVLVNRKGTEFKFDVEDLKKNPDPAKKFVLEPDDIITVKAKIL